MSIDKNNQVTKNNFLFHVGRKGHKVDSANNFAKY